MPLSCGDEVTMKQITRLSILLLLASARLPAQALPPDSLFDRLIGHWVLRGTIARHSTTHDVSFDWMLGREYVQMHEVSRERAADGTPAYEAVVLFGRDPRSGERSEEHTSELQSQSNLVCRLLLEKKKKSNKHT